MDGISNFIEKTKLNGHFSPNEWRKVYDLLTSNDESILEGHLISPEFRETRNRPHCLLSSSKKTKLDGHLK